MTDYLKGKKMKCHRGRYLTLASTRTHMCTSTCTQEDIHAQTIHTHQSWIYVNHERSQDLKDFKALSPAIENPGQRQPKEIRLMHPHRRISSWDLEDKKVGGWHDRLIVPGTTGLENKQPASFSIIQKETPPLSASLSEPFLRNQPSCICPQHQDKAGS